MLLKTLTVNVAISLWHDVKDPPLLNIVTVAVGVPDPTFGVTVGGERETVPVKPKALSAVMELMNVPGAWGTKSMDKGLAVRAK